MGFVCKILDLFPTQTVKHWQSWVIFLEDLLQPKEKEYLSCASSSSESIISVVFPSLEVP